MKKLLGKVNKDFALESFGICLVVSGVAYFSLAIASILLGAFLVWLVESAN